MATEDPQDGGKPGAGAAGAGTAGAEFVAELIK